MYLHHLKPIFLANSMLFDFQGKKMFFLFVDVLDQNYELNIEYTLAIAITGLSCDPKKRIDLIILTNWYQLHR